MLLKSYFIVGMLFNDITVRDYLKVTNFLLNFFLTFYLTKISTNRCCCNDFRLVIAYLSYLNYKNCWISFRENIHLELNNESILLHEYINMYMSQHIYQVKVGYFLSTMILRILR